MPITTPSLDQKTIRTSPILWILGVLFALFLGALGTQGLSDIADLFERPVLSSYRDRLVEPLQREVDALERQPDPRAPAREAARQDVAALNSAVARAESSWESWLATRATLGGTSGEDRSIRRRRDELDALRSERDAAQQQLDALLAEPDPREEARTALQERIQAASKQADREYAAAERLWQWKALAARLALVLPVVVLAIFLWRRRTRISYVTLLWGYWAFTLWMVLWGIGPYLPHYGGYAPLALGMSVTIWGTISLARWLNGRASLRRRRIVDQAIARHRCPGCDRDYLIGRETGLDVGLARKSRTRHYDAEALHPGHCPACGLALFAPCRSCQTVQLVHGECCARCGASPVLSPEPTPA